MSTPADPLESAEAFDLEGWVAARVRQRIGTTDPRLVGQIAGLVGDLADPTVPYAVAALAEVLRRYRKSWGSGGVA